jgi:hypothetical protein
MANLHISNPTFSDYTICIATNGGTKGNKTFDLAGTEQLVAIRKSSSDGGGSRRRPG